MCNFLLTFSFMFSAIYLVLADQNWFVFVFSNKVLFFFVEILSFGFYLVNSVCNAYLEIDQSLVHCSYPKMFLLFFEFNLEPIQVLKPSLNLFWFFLLDLLESCHQLLPACRPGLSVFNSQWNKCYLIKIKGIELLGTAHSYKLMLVSVMLLSANMFLYSFFIHLYSYVFSFLALHSKCQFFCRHL